MQICAMDYQIFQRDAQGYADIYLEGEVPGNAAPQIEIFARVVAEDNNMIVVPWTHCAIENGRWSVSLHTPEGGLYRLEAVMQDGFPGVPDWFNRVKCIYHVGVGDIFVTAGQSNMTGYGKGPAYDPPCLGVHAFSDNGRWDIATHPLTDCVISAFGAEENATGTCPALAFARTLKEKLGIPIGIVPSAVGGTKLELWNPAQDGTLYQRMLKRLEYTGRNIKGILWYQGCSDCNEGDCYDYLERFTQMVSLWRKDLGDVPLLTVQLNRWAGDGHRHWGILRDAQRQAAINIPGVYLISAIDLSCSDGIHNNSASNVILGERIASAALCKLYGKAGHITPFVLSAHRVDDTHLLIQFTDDAIVYPIDDIPFGMDVEDGEGLVVCVKGKGDPRGMLLTTERPYQLPAKFHALWRSIVPSFIARDQFSQPIAACYNIEIEEE